MIDGFVKSPFSALRCILRHYGVAISTPLSSGLARLETEAFLLCRPLTYRPFKNMFRLCIRILAVFERTILIFFSSGERHVIKKSSVRKLQV
jgi:hypothetical protein